MTAFGQLARWGRAVGLALAIGGWAVGSGRASGAAELDYLSERAPAKTVGVAAEALTPKRDDAEGAAEGIEHAIVMPAPAEVHYELDGRRKAFAAAVGVAPGTPRSASVQFEVRLDGRRVCRTEVLRHGDDPAEMYVPLGGASRLTLRVNPADRGRGGDRATWARARLTNEAAPAEGDGRAVADTSVQRKLFFETEIAGERDRRPYLVSMPGPAEAMRAEAEAGGKGWPMLVFLHGIVEGGDDHENLFIEAIPRYLRDRPGYVKRHPYLFLCPAAPWKTRFRREDVSRFVIELVEHVAKTYPVDRERIYLTWLSDGAIGVWHIAVRRPDLFAAIAPVAGRDGPIDEVGEALNRTPAWMCVGGRDQGQVLDTLAMARAYAAGGTAFNLRIEPHRGHVIWDTVYLDDDLYAWLNQWRVGGKRAEPHVEPEGEAGSAAAQVAGLRLLEQAMQRQYDGEAVAMARALRRLEARYPKTIAGRVGRRQREAMGRDRDVAERLKAAADEAAASEMLANALGHRRAGRTGDARRLLHQVVQTWPLTDAADRAERLMKAADGAAGD